ncbi:MAG: hypothetical protein ACR2HF_06375, partial [Methylococcaceae bacterium]
SSLLYTSDGGTGGKTEITFKADDGDPTTVDAEVVLGVEAVTPPSLLLPAQPTVVAGLASELIGLGLLDPDNAANGTPISVTLTPTAGTLKVSAIGSVTVKTLDAGALQLSGQVGDVDDTLNNLEFVANPDTRSAGLHITTDDGDSRTRDADDQIPLKVVSAPKLTVPETPVTTEVGQPTPITGLAVSDFDSPRLTLTVSGSDGTLSLTPAGAATVTGTDTGTLTVTGSPEDLAASLGSLNYTQTTTNHEVSLSLKLGDGDSFTPDAVGTIPLTASSPPGITLPEVQVIEAAKAVTLTGIAVRDADSPELILTLTPTGGSLSLTAQGAATLATQDDGSYRLTGSVDDLNASLSSLSFTAKGDNDAPTIALSLDDQDPNTPDATATYTLSLKPLLAPAAGGDLTVTVLDASEGKIPEDSLPEAANIRLTPTVLTDPNGDTPSLVRILS